MQTCYTIRLSPTAIAIADLVKPRELTYDWTITRINVPEKFRGQGHGSELLQLILADADAEQVPLQLSVFPTGPLGWRALADWYERYGFKMVSTGYMRRRPKKP